MRAGEDALVETGRAVAFLEDDILLAGLKAGARNPAALAFLPEAYDKIYYGLMFPKDDPEFKALVATLDLPTIPDRLLAS